MRSEVAYTEEERELREREGAAMVGREVGRLVVW
jgi:hypothetical protein